MFSPEGTFFRSFLLDEVVKSIDALSREQLVLLVSQLGLQVRNIWVLGVGGGGCWCVGLQCEGGWVGWLETAAVGRSWCCCSASWACRCVRHLLGCVDTRSAVCLFLGVFVFEGGGVDSSTSLDLGAAWQQPQSRQARCRVSTE